MWNMQLYLKKKNFPYVPEKPVIRKAFDLPTWNNKYDLINRTGITLYIIIFFGHFQS